MKVAPIAPNEQARLSALQSYNINMLPESDFDQITKIASQICQTPISLISIIDADKQWFKSKQGINVNETPRDVSFCSHAILNPNEIMEVPNSLNDERFSDNPFVTGDPGVIFYAGVPLVTEAGYPLGTICVIDSKPKELTVEQKETLKALAQQVVCLLELRKKNKELAETKLEMSKVNKELEKFAHIVAHDLKSPCNNLIMLSELLQESYGEIIDAEGKQMLGYMQEASQTLSGLIDEILSNSKIIRLDDQDKQSINLKDFIHNEIVPIVSLPEGFTFLYDTIGNDISITTHKTMLKQIMLNLCTNAVKYNDKQEGYVRINCEKHRDHYQFIVSDNGMGISAKGQAVIFDLFQTLDKRDRNGEIGYGIGLNTVKKLVKKLGGRISVRSEDGVGTSFTFTIKA